MKTRKRKRSFLTTLSSLKRLRIQRPQSPSWLIGSHVPTNAEETENCLRHHRRKLRIRSPKGSVSWANQYFPLRSSFLMAASTASGSSWAGDWTCTSSVPQATAVRFLTHCATAGTPPPPFFFFCHFFYGPTVFRNLNMFWHLEIWGGSQTDSILAVSHTNRAFSELNAVSHPIPGNGSRNALTLINRNWVGLPHQSRLTLPLVKISVRDTDIPRSHSFQRANAHLSGSW